MVDVHFRKLYRKAKCVIDLKIKLRKLKGDGQTSFVEKLIKEANSKDDVDSNVMCNKMADCIRYVVKEELGESKGMVPPNKNTSW